MTKKKPDRCQELMITAQQLFYTKGYENTSINDIVNAVGVSKGAFYHHFASKTAILEAIVDEAMSQLYTTVQAIVADSSLSAIPKWQSLSQLFSSWQTDHQQEVIETGRMLMMEENILVLHKLRTESFQILAIEMSKIIAQGVAEGVFQTEYIQETAEMVMALLTQFDIMIGDLIYIPEKFEDRKTMALRKLRSTQMGIELLLGAPAGSMPIMNEKTLLSWIID